MKSLETGQKIFRDDIKTLTISNPDNFMTPPVIHLNSGERLNINFDILGDNPEYLRYRLIHCNADWKPSNLLESEFIDGFNEDIIDDYVYSTNTYVHYINYNVTIPNPTIPILKSGNYIIQVYPENDEDNIVLQARFSMAENLVSIKGGKTTHTDKGAFTEFQQLFLNLDLTNLGNINPYQDITITAVMNNRPETRKVLKNPNRVENGIAIYEHNPELIFEAGNEYRRFETVRTDYAGMHVDSVKFINGLWHAWLEPDYARNDKEYQFDKTQNGKFKIDEYNSTDPNIGADYVMVHFSLIDDKTPHGDIYIDGDFTNHQKTDPFLMKYDNEEGLYQTDILLKQGSYNYQYIEVDDQNSNSTQQSIEGNKYETNNEFLILVFLRTPSDRADRLVGVTTL